MSEWKEYRLEDFADINPSESIPKGTIAKKIPMEFIQAFTKRIPDYLLEEYKGGVKFRNGDTLMARITPSLENGKTSYVDILDEDEIGFGSTEFIVLREKENISDRQFLYYLAISPTIRFTAIKSMTGSSGRQRVQTDVVKEHIFDAPKLEEQRTIASVLSSLDDKIDLLHRQNQTLEQMAETLFRQWFVEEFDNANYVKLGKLVNTVDNRGKTPPWSEEKTEYPLIEVNALGNRLVDYSKIKKYVDEETFTTWFRAHPKKYDTLLSTVGSIGEFSMFIEEYGSIAQNVVAFQAKGISPFYLYQTLKFFSRDIKEFDIGSVQPSIKVSHLREYEIPVCTNFENFKEFDKISLDICSKLEANQTQISTLTTLRDTLLPKLMSGEVRVEM